VRAAGASRSWRGGRPPSPAPSSLGIGYGDSGGLLGYLLDPAPFTFVDGSIERPTGPGLGIEVDEREVRRAAERGHSWRTPLWRHPDGSLAAW
jgi:galactonate dehydratase